MYQMIKKIIYGIRSKNITAKRIKIAYTNKDLKKLIWFYKNSQPFRKNMIVRYIGKGGGQKEFEFMLNEIKTENNIQLKTILFATILDMVLDKTISLKKEDSKYLNKNLNLLNNLDLENYNRIDSMNQEIVF